MRTRSAAPSPSPRGCAAAAPRCCPLSRRRSCCRRRWVGCPAPTLSCPPRRCPRRRTCSSASTRRPPAGSASWPRCWTPPAPPSSSITTPAIPASGTSRSSTRPPRPRSPSSPTSSTSSASSSTGSWPPACTPAWPPTPAPSGSAAPGRRPTSSPPACWPPASTTPRSADACSTPPRSAGWVCSPSSPAAPSSRPRSAAVWCGRGRASPRRPSTAWPASSWRRWSTSSGPPRRPTSPACSRGRTTAGGGCRCAPAAPPTSPGWRWPSAAAGTARRRATPAAWTARPPWRRCARSWQLAEPAPRSVLSLAAPALVVLAAEPLYLLVDTAVVGHLGTVALGGLAVGGGLLAWAGALLNFLAYGTTARAARLFGAGNRAGAVAEGVQASWLALVLGVGVLLLFQLLAGPLTRLLAGSAGPVAAAGETWLRIASFGLPLLLLSLAGNGWLRGVQELHRPVRYVLAGSLVSLVLCPLLVFPAGLGLPGSAVANVAGQAVAAGLFVRALRREGVPLRPRPAAIRAQLGIGRDLLLRAAVLQLSFLVAAGVVAREGTAALGAHQIALQLFFFLALVLDAYAIAAQTLVGHALGAERPDDARATARRVTLWGLATGVLLAAVLLALRGVLLPLFTDDPAVLEQAELVWWFLAGIQPLAGVVFALDGVLMGAGDVGYLRTLTIGSALVGFLPLSLLSHPLGWGLAGVWTGLDLFIGLRLVGVLARVAGPRWLSAGVGR